MIVSASWYVSISSVYTSFLIKSLEIFTVVERANSSGKDGKTVSSLCAFCARMKRGNLYTCARKNNCNKLVLGKFKLKQY